MTNIRECRCRSTFSGRKVISNRFCRHSLSDLKGKKYTFRAHHVVFAIHFVTANIKIRFSQLTRSEFESINEDLFKSIEQPIGAALEDAQITPDDVSGGNIGDEEEFECLILSVMLGDNTVQTIIIFSSQVDEIVLVGGSTRIPKVRQIVGRYFK